MKTFTAFFIVYALFLNDFFACTTVIISGKAAPDGRPLLYKHRDSGHNENKLMLFNDGKYYYIGLVNGKDKLGKEVWAGCNSAGFAIMNSASYNLKYNDTTKLVDQEGFVMKLALQNCATLEEFEALLNSLPKPLGVEANFGVIDAFGGAAYYETDNFKFVKYDVNDPNVAPNGYLIRTNYSFSGLQNEGYGQIRYETTEKLIESAFANNQLTPQFLLQNVSRCLRHSLIEENLWDAEPDNFENPKFVYFEDFVPRPSSVSVMVVQGTAPNSNEIPALWNLLGFPLTSPVAPVWLTDEVDLPNVLTAKDSVHALLCDFSLKLKSELFPLQSGGRNKYMNLSKLINKDSTGFMQKIIDSESIIYSKAIAKNEQFKFKIDPIELKAFYDWFDMYVINLYNDKFGLSAGSR